MTYNLKLADLKDLIGKTFTSVTHESSSGSDKIYFRNDQEEYVLLHDQECCEDVDLEDIYGELSYLENSPILVAEESTNNAFPRDASDESFLWSFYKFATVKGWVDLRWYGVSNGYYSEYVQLYFIPKELKDEL